MAAGGTQLVCFMLIITFFHEACSQPLIAVSTVPYSSMIVSQPENATNVTLYCKVFRVGIGQRSSEWSIRRHGDATDTDLRFSLVDGTGMPGAENFFVTGGILQTNLTIRVFSLTFDRANISCGAGPDVAINGTFRLRIISEFPPYNHASHYHTADIYYSKFYLFYQQSSPYSGHCV